MSENRSVPAASVLAFHDIRWNSWRWRPILERWGYLKVFINPDIVKTTTFLLSNGEIASSTFFVKVPLDPANRTLGSAYYVATTNHSVKGSVEIRFNRKGAEPEDIPTLEADWYREAELDIAVWPVKIPVHNYDIEWISLDLFARDADYLHVEPIQVDEVFNVLIQRYGIGDEVFSVGLFEGHSGTSLAQPVVRFGHIALRPALGEKVFAEIDPAAELVPMDAFLVEMSAWAGQSGSPVFLRPYPFIGERDHKNTDSELNYLIGMIQGFYPGEQDVKINGQEATLSPLNMGIGIVIPSYVITEVLMRPKLREGREKTLRDKRANPKIRPSAASINKEARL